MSTITANRFEVKRQVDELTIGHAASMEGAETVAQNWIDQNHQPVTITDHMARRSKPNFYTVTECTGAAHANAFIDHCAVCMPRWGIIVKGSRK